MGETQTETDRVHRGDEKRTAGRRCGHFLSVPCAPLHPTPPARRQRQRQQRSTAHHSVHAALSSTRRTRRSHPPTPGAQTVAVGTQVMGDSEGRRTEERREGGGLQGEWALRTRRSGISQMVSIDEGKPRLIDMFSDGCNQLKRNARTRVRTTRVDQHCDPVFPGRSRSRGYHTPMLLPLLEA